MRVLVIRAMNLFNRLIGYKIWSKEMADSFLIKEEHEGK